jgi:hypothetical protein
MDGYLLPGNEKFLWIAWVFGYEQEFCALATKLQAQVSTNALGQCITRQDKLLESDMPPDIVGKPT